MSNYFESFEKNKCNGCGVCALRCPKKAIEMIEDEEGFLYPKIDEKKCINCGLCRKICSNNPKKNTYKQKVYAAKNKDEKERSKSTSGGIFKILSKKILHENGIVFGVKYNDKLEVIHSYARTLNDCKEFSMSKYVRSNINCSFEQVEVFLKEGKKVLFSGTPCQCYGLRNFLRRDYDNLILVEIMCHSNPSPKVFKLFIENIELNKNKKIERFYFRSKIRGPYAQFEDGSIYEINSFNTAFNKMLISRPSCSECKFCDTNRKSDITIGDYWGIEKFFPNMQDDKGVSLLCINTKKGEEFFDKIKDELIYEESNIEDGFKYNHNCNLKYNKNREKFFKQLKNEKINNMNIINYLDKYSANTMKEKIKMVIKKILHK